MGSDGNLSIIVRHLYTRTTQTQVVNGGQGQMIGRWYQGRSSPSVEKLTEQPCLGEKGVKRCHPISESG